MRRSLVIVAACAVLVAGVAWQAWPEWRAREALARIVADGPEQRVRGWSWFIATVGDEREHRAASHVAEIERRLRGATDDALLDGATVLDTLSLWSWQRQPDLVLREVHVRALSGRDGDAFVAAERMMTCPLELAWSSVRDPLGALTTSRAPEVRRRAVEAALGWAGRERAALVASLAADQPDPELRRLLSLARVCGTPAGARLEAAPGISPGEMAYVVHRTGGPEAETKLAELAAQGDRVAANALRLRRGEPPPEALRAVALDPANPSWQRRLAAWHGAALDADEIDALLAADPIEPDGSVYGTALLVERTLARADAVDLAARWIGDLRDDRKRAGALLSALLGVHADRLAAALAVEDMPAVRTAQRLALFALGAPVGPDDPHEFAARTLHGSRGDFDPDTALCLLRAGRADTLAMLVSRPADDPEASRGSVQQRAWLIERFVPAWHADAGRPLGGSTAAIDLHFGLLRARQLLTRRRMRFDPETATFAEEADDRDPGG